MPMQVADSKKPQSVVLYFSKQLSKNVSPAHLELFLQSSSEVAKHICLYIEFQHLLGTAFCCWWNMACGPWQAPVLCAVAEHII